MSIKKEAWENLFAKSGLTANEFGKEVLLMAANLAETVMNTKGADEMTATYDIRGKVVRSTFTIEVKS